jgi:hypothetical protein
MPKAGGLARLSPGLAVGTCCAMRKGDPAPRWSQDPAAPTCREMLRGVGQGHWSRVPEDHGLNGTLRGGGWEAGSPDNGWWRGLNLSKESKLSKIFIVNVFSLMRDSRITCGRSFSFDPHAIYYYPCD